MGGGAAMRTAAKIAGVGVARSGVRGVPPAEHSVRSASLPASAAAASVSSQVPKVTTEVASPHAVPWEYDNWELLDGGELVMAGGEPMPRVVFGGVPTFQETKEATTELKDAIDNIYLSSYSSQFEGSSPGSQVSVLSPTHSEPETQSRVIDAISVPSVPKHALQAFQFLSTNPEAQTVVASIACDPNVWNAVMQNPAVNNFLQSRQTVADFKTEETPEKVETVAGSEAGKTSEKVKTLPESKERSGFFNFFDFRGLLKNAKLTVTDFVRSLSSYLPNIFPFSTAENEKPDTADADVKTSFMDNKTTAGTVMVLAVLVMMVVLVKRA